MSTLPSFIDKATEYASSPPPFAEFFPDADVQRLHGAQQKFHVSDQRPQRHGPILEQEKALIHPPELS
jgi:hypothetical protein